MPDKTHKPTDDTRRLATLRARTQELRGMLRVANALVQAGRAVDLTGLEEQVGRLCAATLDLPPHAGRRLRADLVDLHADAEMLTASLRALPSPP